MSNKIGNLVLRKEERQSDGYKYSYELLVREGNSTIDFRMPLYSIKVNMIDSEGRSREADARDVFSSKKKAMAFFEKIVRNLATPIDLPYIIEDEVTG